MLKYNIEIEADVCHDILVRLLASYKCYAREAQINPRDTSTDFGKVYNLLVKEANKSNYYQKEEEIQRCNKIIESSKQYLLKIGGEYV